ncbi:hypothetical protein [Microbacterium indicum]|uniref:hypothetical protein n=1 Tax=Microbacterium indicum TaxID=358100 RepID=UPI000407A4C3|nr:hypothetical protein [Microbacterium indicum]
MANPAPPRKVQLTVPPADTTVSEWLDAQYSSSESIRRLIRESVAREGFVDVANRPVTPPKNPVRIAETFPGDPDEPFDVVDPDPAPEVEARLEPDLAFDLEPETAPAAPPKKSAAPKGSQSRADARAAAAAIDDILGL